MLVQEIIQPEVEGGWILVKTYSDAGFKVRQIETGTLYVEAIDPEFAHREYEETDIPEDYEEPEEEPIEEEENTEEENSDEEQEVEEPEEGNEE